MAVILTLVVSGAALLSYLQGPLNGEFNHYILSSEIFGVPESLKARGITPLYVSGVVSGWDGQFYYYISNDILGTTDIPKHLDIVSYRYQRIGFPLFAKMVSLLLFQDWVSPAIYYFSHLGLILFATFMGAFLFANATVPISPFWILAWSLSVGTQLTLLNGLPDAAADSFAILAFCFFYRRYYFLYGMFILFAALSREVYILIPVFQGLHQILQILFKKNNESSYIKNFEKNIKGLVLRLPRSFWFHFGSALFVVFWQIYVWVHFDQSPATQSQGIIGLPFKTTLEFFKLGLDGHYPLIDNRYESHMAGVSIALYLGVLGIFSWSLFKILPQSFKLNPEWRGWQWSSIVILGLYLCFGPTVMIHFSGYMKAASFFLFLIPLVFFLSKKAIPIWVTLFVVVLNFFFALRFYDERLAQKPIEVLKDRRCGQVNFTSASIECLPLFVWSGSQLPAQIGRVNGNERIAQGPPSGYISYGPYVSANNGRYEISIEYQIDNKADVPVSGLNSYWEIGSFVKQEKIFFKQNLNFNSQAAKTQIIINEQENLQLEVRVFFDGQGLFKLKQLTIEKKVN